MRIKRGRGKGKLPHEAHVDVFIKYLIVEGMTDDDYWFNHASGNRHAARMDKAIILNTNQLSDDQRGWALNDYPSNKKGPWVIRAEKPSKPQPITPMILIRHRRYSAGCSCAQPDYNKYAKRWDGVQLYICEECAEVVLAEVEGE
jgi:hypothetical protein